MPRVRSTNGHAAASASASRVSSHTSPTKTIQIPLNDDREEKAQRLHNRQQKHARYMSEIKQAATPQKGAKRRSLIMGDPSMPGYGEDDIYEMPGDSVTPAKPFVPILATFEEQLKLTTDNKINADNSWGMELIDYFHDMRLLKEGEGVNFQKASCTLDGCVKIYTTRVDSVGVETGKLMSGLADGKKRGGANAEDAEENDDDEEGEDGAKKKTRKRTQKTAETTLVTSFEQLRSKKMELEFAVDPLFKKASADFDEGGAKGLLLNHLSIDGTGRIVFDSSDDTQEAEGDESRRDSMNPDEHAKELEPEPEDGPIDVASLGLRFFPDLDKLDEEDICPTMKDFELGGGDASAELPFLKAPENWRDEHPDPETSLRRSRNSLNKPRMSMGDNPPEFDYDDDDAGPGGFDMEQEVGFGEGGEAWARDAALQPQMRVFEETPGADSGDEAGGEVGVYDPESNAYAVKLQHRSDNDQENILNYFDNALQKNWAGPEHWKIARIKETTKEAPKKTRKEKEPFEIDFAAPMSQEMATLLYTTAPNNSQICLPAKERKSKTRNLLPDDKHFNSKELLQLFLKPKAKLGIRKTGAKQQPGLLPNGEVDEAYWASQSHDHIKQQPLDDDDVQGNYDANFFQDDGLPMAGVMDDEDDFVDAVEGFFSGVADEFDAGGPVGGGIDAVADPQEPGADKAFGANLIAQSRRMRPEYVQYARTAKKVDVRRLKEELWRSIGFGQKSSENLTPAKRPQAPPLCFDDRATLKFTDIMNNLQNVYPKQQMDDISTSYGFICLLHLANEKGLVIENVEDFTDLSVRKDFEAVDHEVA